MDTDVLCIEALTQLAHLARRTASEEVLQVLQDAMDCSIWDDLDPEIRALIIEETA